MIGFKTSLRFLVTSAVAAATSASAVPPAHPPAAGPAAVAAPSLGASAAFAVLAGSTVTSVGATTLNASLGVNPGLTVTGFPPGLLTAGAIHSGDTTAQAAKADLGTAFDALSADGCTGDLSGVDLSGLTLVPGVYCFSAAGSLTGALTLDAQGNPDAVFIFKMGSTLTTGSGATVTLINSGQDCNVFWQVGSSATIGVGTTLVGNILAFTSITVNTGATISGRVLAQNGAVTLDTNHVSATACAPASPCAGQPNGTPCDDANGCTLTDTCQSGACVGANPVVCGNGGACNVGGSCAPATGTCTFPGPPCASSTGDPHILTFDGVLYDLMATGDFVLLRASGVVIQVRQAKLLADWNVSFNVAAAAEFGADRITVLTSPFRVLANGKPLDSTSVAQTLPDGTSVALHGTVVAVASRFGSVTFTVYNDTTIDVKIALDASVTDVTGLMGNRDGKADNDLVSREGQHLALPIASSHDFDLFAASWVVPQAESLLSTASGHSPNQTAASEVPPYQPLSPAFTAADLAPEAYAAAEHVCRRAHVSDGALLAACALDVAVLGTPSAAQAFVSLVTPTLVLTLTDGSSERAAAGGCSTAARPNSGWAVIWLTAIALLALRMGRSVRVRARTWAAQPLVFARLTLTTQANSAPNSTISAE